MRSKYMYINSTSGRKFVIGNGFSDPDFLQDANASPVNQRLRAFSANQSKPEVKLRACLYITSGCVTEKNLFLLLAN